MIPPNPNRPPVELDSMMSQEFRDWTILVSREITGIENETYLADLQADVATLLAQPVQTVTEGSYTAQGYREEVIICNNESAITVTLPALQNIQVVVIRANTGAVDVTAPDSTINGAKIQTMLSRYDSFDLVGTDIGWFAA